MPWKECSVMDERLRFVARLLDGEGMSQVCREFGISRKTGYKILTRYNEVGLGRMKKPLLQGNFFHRRTRFTQKSSCQSGAVHP